MNDDTLGVSRRKLLGAMGTIGGAAALGGASTMAFFSDEEEFSDNRLVAGELDLKVDWQEYYSDWSPDESAGLRFDPVMDLEDIPEQLRDEVDEFFETYKNLEAGKRTETLGWEDRAAALEAVEHSQNLYEQKFG